MSKFFIERPIFAWVIAIMIMMAGALAIFTLPVEQYPRLAPPAIMINASYPGASAKMLEDSVTQVIEQKMSGLDHFRYMSSTSDSAGNVSILITFDQQANPDIAQVQVQNKLQLATSQLPQEVQQLGISVTKSTHNFLLFVGLRSTDGRFTQYDLSDWAASHLQDPLSRINGVGDVILFGAQHSMRIWLNPDKLVNYKLTASEVTSAISAQNVDISPGQLGGNPAIKGQQLNATITAQTRLETQEEFGNILLRVNQDGSQVRLRDVARIELGSENYQYLGKNNGLNSTSLAIRAAVGANALDVAKAVRARISELTMDLPAGVEVVYPYDTTPFVKISIYEVFKTLGEAIVLVFLIMYLFLQNFRATLIPTIAVPVVLLGTFGVMAAVGFTINTLSMFAMVLAIGLLVDDAIVVVENVERLMSEEGLSPHDATRKSMDQITGALIGIALVLSAVFVPMAFFSGSTGGIYRQFSLTIVSAMVLSVLVALILTPALCATMLKPVERGHSWTNTGFFGWFNRGFNFTRRFYRISVNYVIHRVFRYLFLYILICGGLVFLFVRLPTAFLPDEDQGVMLVQVTAPAGSTMERTQQTMDKIQHYFQENEKDTVQSVYTVVGFSFAGRGQNSGLAFILLKDWGERKQPQQKLKPTIGRAMQAFSQIKDANIFVFAPPAVPELGTATGFDFELVDNAGIGHEKLTAARNMLLGMAWQNPNLMMVRPNGLEDTPQYKINIDQEKATALGLSISDINNTLSTAWGSSYVNDFMDNGRTKKVYVQADAPFRMLPDDLNRWYVKNSAGDMTPFSTFSSSKWMYGSPQLERYNGVSSMEILGSPATGKSSGEAMKAMEQIASKLPPGVGYQWTGLSYEEKLAGSQAPALYAISIMVVFLSLAALYESWAIPFSVIMVVPLGILGAVGATTLCSMPNDVYFQVGLLTTMGLSAKNAILIVEFAKNLYQRGQPLFAAIVEAAHQRLRPILMTSLAFTLGVLPLAIANGAGSGSQNAVGIGVLGGMISATILAIFFVPAFYVFIMRHFAKPPRRLSRTEE